MSKTIKQLDEQYQIDKRPIKIVKGHHKGYGPKEE